MPTRPTKLAPCHPTLSLPPLAPAFALLIGMCCGPVSTTALADNGATLSTLPAPRPAPDFTLPGIDGDEHRLAASRGRYLLVNFWAVWCQPCRKEMPSMERLYGKLNGAEFDVLAIHVGPNIENAKRAAKGLGVTFPVAVDERMGLTAWEVRGLPTSFLLDPEGNIIAQAVGDREWDGQEMIEAIERLMHAGDSLPAHRYRENAPQAAKAPH